MRRIALALALLAIGSVAQAQVSRPQYQQPRPQQMPPPAAAPAYQMIAPPQQPVVPPGVWSVQLQSRFSIRWLNLPGLQPVLAAYMETDPSPYSPLNTLGLRRGDWITRLDGISLTNYAEIDNHYTTTTVRYVRGGTVTPLEGVVQLPQTLPNGVVPSQGGYPGGGPLIP